MTTPATFRTHRRINLKRLIAITRGDWYSACQVAYARFASF